MKKKLTLLVLWVTLVTVSIGTPGNAQSTSELLEKAIYTEETVGDLEQAIKIYEQVVAEGQATREYAARAQYRLALCLQKMGKKEEATAAFQAVATQYADQPELVAKAKQHLPSDQGLQLIPVPWSDGEQLQLTAKLATGLEIGTFTLSAHQDQLDDQDVWRMQIGRYIAINAPNQGISRVVADRATFRPISSIFRHTILGTIEVEYTEDQAEVNSRGVDGKQTKKELNLDGTYYDNEQGMYLFRRLPMKVGYQAEVPICSPIGAGPIKIEVKVTGKETIQVKAGEFECYRLHLPLLQQTFWYATEGHRALVKFEAGGISAELTAMRNNRPAELVTQQDDQYRFSIAAPTEWYFVKPQETDSESKRVSYILLDPEAAAISRLLVQPVDELEEDEQASPRAWADADIQEAKRAYKDYEVRPDSWQPRELSGQPAVSFVADYMHRDRPMVEYCVYSQGDANAVVFCSKMEKDWFDKLSGELNSIIDSYQAN